MSFRAQGPNEQPLVQPRLHHLHFLYRNPDLGAYPSAGEWVLGCYCCCSHVRTCRHDSGTSDDSGTGDESSSEETAATPRTTTDESNGNTVQRTGRLDWIGA
jgi:hypothetical protein